MDPITQGTLGACLPQSTSKKSTVFFAGIIGFLSGLAPDLDVFIRSDNDPLLFLEFHRQFTHSLLFIPIGGLICASVFYLLLKKWHQLTFKQTYIFSTLGYGTHGLLDSCTSYGTQLFWPLSNHRYAWDTISIIDPLFTIPVLLCVILAAIKKQPKFALVGLMWAITYQLIGAYQNHRASEVGYHLASQRGHTPIRLEAKPSFGNLILWKVIYETAQGFHTDGVRIGFSTKVFPGTLIPKVDVQRDFPWLDPSSQQAKDLQRFTWFSQGYVSVDPNNPARVIDARYSLLPNENKGLWSIWLSPNASHNQHVEYRMDREINDEKRKIFLDMLFDK